MTKSENLTTRKPTDAELRTVQEATERLNRSTLRSIDEQIDLTAEPSNPPQLAEGSDADGPSPAQPTGNDQRPAYESPFFSLHQDQVSDSQFRRST